MNTHKRTQTRRILFLVLAATGLLLAACQRPAFLDAKLPDDGPPVPSTQQAALRFVEKVANAGQSGVQSGQTALTITQSEVTSFLNIGSQISAQLQQFQNVETLGDLAQIENIEDLQIEGLDSETLRRLQQFGGSQEGVGRLRLPDLRLRLAIKELEVRFQGNGHIIVRGYGQVRSVRQPLRVVVAPRASDGQLVLDFVEGKLGPVPLPEPLFDLVGKALSRVILAGQDYAAIQEITVGEGTLTLRGRYSKESLDGLCPLC